MTEEAYYHNGGRLKYRQLVRRRNALSYGKSKITIFPHTLHLTPPLTGFPLELGIMRKWSKTRMMGLSDGQKSFKIGLAVWKIYRRVTVRRTDRHLDSAGKNSSSILD